MPLKRLSSYHGLLCLVGAIVLQLSTSDACAQSFDEVISGVNEFAKSFRIYRLKYEHTSIDIETGKEVASWTSTESRAGSNYRVLQSHGGKDYPVGYAWHNGTCVRLGRRRLTIEPSYNVAFSQISSYTNYLFVDVTPDNAVLAAPAKRIFQTTEPSGLFPLSLPGSIQRHRDAFQIARVDKGRLRLTRGDGRDIIEFNPDKGYVCTYRRYEQSPGKPLLEVFNEELTNAADGLWLPKTQRIIKFHSALTDEGKAGEPSREEKNRLISFDESDGIVDSEFELPIPADVSIYDRVRSMSYKKVDRELTPEEALKKAVLTAQASGASLSPKSGSRTLLLLNSLVILSIFAGYRYQKLSKRRVR